MIAAARLVSLSKTATLNWRIFKIEAPVTSSVPKLTSEGAVYAVAEEPDDFSKLMISYPALPMRADALSFLEVQTDTALS